MTAEPLLSRVKTVTGWTDAKLAKALGLPRSTVTAYASGRRTENLTDSQRALLLSGLRKRLESVAALINEMEGG